jgi:hypothetical protein
VSAPSLHVEPALHVAPSWRAVTREQVKTVNMRIRRLMYLVICLYGVLVGVGILIALRARELNAKQAAYQMANFTFTPRAVFPLLILAIIVPLLTWEGEGPSRRSYHLMMPMPQHRHSLTRVFAGWVWLMVATAAYLVAIVLTVAVMERLTGNTQPYEPFFIYWEWLVPFTSVSIVYLLASAATLATEQPLLWILGVTALLGGSIAVLHMLGFEDGSRALQKIYSGKYGAVAAFLGIVEWRADNGTLYPSLGRWLGATAIWAIGSGVVLRWLSARRTESPS